VSSRPDGFGELPYEVGRRAASSKANNRQGAGEARQFRHATQRRLLAHVVQGSDNKGAPDLAQCVLSYGSAE
jgi:hypothetical protein